MVIFHVMLNYQKVRSPSYPICSMYGIFTLISAIFGVNAGKYSIHGASGYGNFVVTNKNKSGKTSFSELIAASEVTRTTGSGR